MLFINKLFNSIACLLYFINLQLVIPGRTWILLYLDRTVYKRLWACLALYIDKTNDLQLMMNSSLHQLKTHKKLFQKVNCLKSLHDNFQIFKSDELLISMLSNTEGEQWRVLRTVISPTFSTGETKTGMFALSPRSAVPDLQCGTGGLWGGVFD